MAASYRQAVGGRGGQLRPCRGPHGLRDTQAHGGEQAGAGEQQARPHGAAARGHAGGSRSGERGWSGRRLITRLNPPRRARHPRCRRPLAARERSAGEGDPERCRIRSVHTSSWPLRSALLWPRVSVSVILALHPDPLKTTFSPRKPRLPTPPLCASSQSGAPSWCR